jgi:signal transduction histidine kinase
MKPRHRQQPQDQDNSSSALPGQWLFYFIAAAGVIISLFLWYAFVLQSSANLKHVIQLQAEHVAKDIDVQLKLRISALKHMAKHLQSESPISDENWQEIAEYLLEYGGFETVSWLSPSLDTLKSSPSPTTPPNPLYPAWIKRYAAEIQKTAQNNEIWLSPLLENQPAQEEDIFAVIPVRDKNQQLLGYLVTVIDLEGALELPLYHVDYAVGVYYDNHPIFENNISKASDQIAPYVAELSFYGTHWKVTVQPSKHFITTIASHLSGIALTLGICLAILFGVTARLALLTRQRARTLDTMNLDLKKEISERVLAEDSKQKLEKSMLQGQKLQAIGTMAGGIAHDFNNILYAIIGYTEMAREDAPAGSLMYANLGKVLEGSHRGRELVARILAFGRRQLHQDFQPFPLKAGLEGALALLRPTIPTTVTIQFIAKVPDDLQIIGNETQLHQVIVNLINNAVDAMNSDGKITLELSVIEPDDEILKQLPGLAKSSYCEIKITDTGHGMSPATVERIFEPFFTTKEVGKGSGLGLAIVHAIIEDHQGKISVNSEIGKGSVFTIILPTYSPTGTPQGD